MSRSLSLVLPVCNAETNLAENLQQLFEVLNDLTERFEVLLVDEGSTDQTVEVARDLAIQYPQVRLARCQGDAGTTDLTDGTLAEAMGDVVIVQKGHAAPRPSVLRKLWAMNERAAGPGPAAVRARGGLPGLPPRCCGVPARRAWTEVGGLRMIQRR